MKMNVEDVHQEVANALGTLATLFKPHAKLTFVMRNPDYEDGGMFISDDDPQKVIESIRKTCSISAEKP